ncbi:uncharacterized protein [Musca autumnalis]|uniref:uncharacterized protein n=1 Tax=Musca autumnalis TaxID=221902 RepID=UPI003CF274BC
MQNNAKLIINNYSQQSLQQQRRHHHHQQHPHNNKTSASLYTTCSLGELNDTNSELQMQNTYNAQQQMKLDQIENYENCMELHGMEQQKLNNALVMGGKGKMSVAHNPNGGTLSSPEDLDLMMVDALYRKGSSSHSSSYESEVLSKKSSESFDSISYRQLQNNNNELNSKDSPQRNTSQSNSSSSTESSSKHKKSNGGGILNGGGGSLLSSAAMVLNGGGNGSGDSLPSITTSSGSTPPPEYELKELPSSKSAIVPNVIKHRELPVDVPDSFIEMVKTTPRYPPPAHLSSLSSQISSCSSASTANTTLTRINSTNNSNTESMQNHNISLSPQSLKGMMMVGHQQQQQQETSLISTMSLNGSFEDFQMSQQQQQAYQQHGTQMPQPQVAGLQTAKRNDEVCVPTHQELPIYSSFFGNVAFYFCQLLFYRTESRASGGRCSKCLP